MQDKVLSMVGLATRAGKTVSGEFMVLKAIKEKSAYLVIVANDASPGTKKQFNDKCSFYKVPIYSYGLKDDLGHSMGKAFRAALAVTDSDFSNAIIKLLNENASDDLGGF